MLLGLSSVAQAIPFFEITTATKEINLSPGAVANVTYTITSRVNTDISNMEYIPPALASRSGGTCTDTLNQGAACTVVLTVRVPDQVQSVGRVLLEPLRVCGIKRELLCNVANRANQVHLNIIVRGHFVFRNESGEDISTLDLAPSQTGTLTLRNTGGSPITRFTLIIPAEIASYFTGSCRDRTELGKDEECQLSYMIPAVPAIGSYSIDVIGSNAENSPLSLGVTVATRGRFVFRNTKGADIKDLDLTPNQTGTVVLRNTGVSSITGISLTFSPEIDSYFTGSCRNISQLAKDAQCQLSYAIPAVPTAGSYSIEAIGSNAENSPLRLGVTIAVRGHFVFRNAQGTDITSLDLVPGNTGTITLRNTGGGIIGGISLTFSPEIDSTLQGAVGVRLS